MKIFSALVIVFVSFIVFIGAGFVLRACILDSNSNIHLIQQLASSAINSSNFSLEAHEALVTKAPTPTIEPFEVKASCDSTIDRAPVDHVVSVVDYLKTYGLPNSYEARMSIAANYGIADYDGSVEKNLLLLNYVHSDINAIEGCSAI